MNTEHEGPSAPKEGFKQLKSPKKHGNRRKRGNPPRDSPRDDAPGAIEALVPDASSLLSTASGLASLLESGELTPAALAGAISSVSNRRGIDLLRATAAQLAPEVRAEVLPRVARHWMPGLAPPVSDTAPGLVGAAATAYPAIMSNIAVEATHVALSTVACRTVRKPSFTALRILLEKLLPLLPPTSNERAACATAALNRLISIVGGPAPIDPTDAFRAAAVAEVVTSPTPPPSGLGATLRRAMGPDGPRGTWTGPALGVASATLPPVEVWPLLPLAVLSSDKAGPRAMDIALRLIPTAGTTLDAALPALADLLASLPTRSTRTLLAAYQRLAKASEVVTWLTRDVRRDPMSPVAATLVPALFPCLPGRCKSILCIRAAPPHPGLVDVGVAYLNAPPPPRTVSGVDQARLLSIASIPPTLPLTDHSLTLALDDATRSTPTLVPVIARLMQERGIPPPASTVAPLLLGRPSDVLRATLPFIAPDTPLPQVTLTAGHARAIIDIRQTLPRPAPPPVPSVDLSLDACLSAVGMALGVPGIVGSKLLVFIESVAPSAPVATQIRAVAHAAADQLVRHRLSHVTGAGAGDAALNLLDNLMSRATPTAPRRQWSAEVAGVLAIEICAAVHYQLSAVLAGVSSASYSKDRLAACSRWTLRQAVPLTIAAIKAQAFPAAACVAFLHSRRLSFQLERTGLFVPRRPARVPKCSNEHGQTAASLMGGLAALTVLQAVALAALGQNARCRGLADEIHAWWIADAAPEIINETARAAEKVCRLLVDGGDPIAFRSALETTLAPFPVDDLASSAALEAVAIYNVLHAQPPKSTPKPAPGPRTHCASGWAGRWTVAISGDRASTSSMVARMVNLLGWSVLDGLGGRVADQVGRRLGVKHDPRTPIHPPPAPPPVSGVEALRGLTATDLGRPTTTALLAATVALDVGSPAVAAVWTTWHATYPYLARPIAEALIPLATDLPDGHILTDAMAIDPTLTPTLARAALRHPGAHLPGLDAIHQSGREQLFFSHRLASTPSDVLGLNIVAGLVGRTRVDFARVLEPLKMTIEWILSQTDGPAVRNQCNKILLTADGLTRRGRGRAHAIQTIADDLAALSECAGTDLPAGTQPADPPVFIDIPGSPIKGDRVTHMATKTRPKRIGQTVLKARDDLRADERVMLLFKAGDELTGHRTATYEVTPLADRAPGPQRLGGGVISCLGDVTPLFSLLPVRAIVPAVPSAATGDRSAFLQLYSALASRIGSPAGAASPDIIDRVHMKCRSLVDPLYVVHHVYRTSRSFAGLLHALDRALDSSVIPSAVGHLVDLRDRHLHNILLMADGSLAHIDHAVSLGAHLALPVPDPAPFRLSPAIAALLGPGGVGAFEVQAGAALDAISRVDLLWGVMGSLEGDGLLAWINPARRAAVARAAAVVHIAAAISGLPELESLPELKLVYTPDQIRPGQTRVKSFTRENGALVDAIRRLPTLAATSTWLSRAIPLVDDILAYLDFWIDVDPATPPHTGPTPPTVSIAALRDHLAGIPADDLMYGTTNDLTIPVSCPVQVAWLRARLESRCAAPDIKEVMDAVMDSGGLARMYSGWLGYA